LFRRSRRFRWLLPRCFGCGCLSRFCRRLGHHSCPLAL
jgi:hypothetical protein